MASPLDDEYDTELARRLHETQALDLPTLQACLGEVREGRTAGSGASLAVLLIKRGLVAAHLVDEAVKGKEPAPPSATAPASFGPYTVVRELARGGMGVVYEVEHTTTRIRYALKTLLPRGVVAAALGGDLERLHSEALAMARLEHPHVVRIHVADFETDVPYLVQTLMPGGSLRDRLQKQGPLPVDEAVRITIQLAGALEYSHGQGVLHRDLKPRNILFDEEGRPRLADFGLARLIDTSLRLTVTGAMVGSPGYMAPEQVEAKREAVGPYTDVYGLGGVLYAMLTGRAPVKVAGGPFAILYDIFHRPPDSPRSQRPEVPEVVERVCMRALEKKPGDRYSSAAAMAEALEPGRPPDAPRAGRWVAAGGLAFAALLVAIGVFAFQTPAADEPPAPDPTPVHTKVPEKKKVALAWNHQVGSKERFVLVYKPDARPDPKGNSFWGEFGLHQQVKEVGPARVLLEVEIEWVKVKGVFREFGQPMPVDLDSRTEQVHDLPMIGDMVRPWFELSGQTFQLQLKPTGQVERVSGLTRPARLWGMGTPNEVIQRALDLLLPRFPQPAPLNEWYAGGVTKGQILTGHRYEGQLEHRLVDWQESSKVATLETRLQPEWRSNRSPERYTLSGSVRFEKGGLASSTVTEIVEPGDPPGLVLESVFELRRAP